MQYSGAFCLYLTWFINQIIETVDGIETLWTGKASSLHKKPYRTSKAI